MHDLSEDRIVVGEHRRGGSEKTLRTSRSSARPSPTGWRAAADGLGLARTQRTAIHQIHAGFEERV